MLRVSKTQFNRAIQANADSLANAELRPKSERYNGSPTPRTRVKATRSKHGSRAIITVFVILIGTATGWLGGQVLNGQMSHPPVDDPSMDLPALDGSTPRPLPEAQPPANRDSRVPLASQPAPESEPPIPLKLLPPEEKQAPPKPTKVDSEDSAPEDPVKEIGREALRKMSRDVKGMRRGGANKNENDGNRK